MELLNFLITGKIGWVDGDEEVSYRKVTQRQFLTWISTHTRINTPNNPPLHACSNLASRSSSPMNRVFAIHVTKRRSQQSRFEKANPSFQLSKRAPLYINPSPERLLMPSCRRACYDIKRILRNTPELRREPVGRVRN